MRLARFIEENSEAILGTWEDFARKLSTSPDSMPTADLRDHAAEMLEWIREELASGKRHDIPDFSQRFPPIGMKDSAAAQHGNQRMEWGFSVRDMIAEFTALRASVIRLWSEQTPRMNRDDLIAFDAAIDEAQTESVDRFTSRKERQARLLETTLSYSSDHTAIFDPDGTILYANKSLAQAYRSHPHELEGQDANVLDAAFAKEAHELIARVCHGKREVRGDFTVTMTGGEEHVIDYLFAPVLGKDDEVEAIAFHSRDISGRRELERTLWRHANHDQLTGVPNRRLFFDRLEHDMLLTRRLGGLLAVLYIDLDEFKSANDRLGHEAGDRLLVDAANRITSCTRASDTVARIGGDEFTVILTGAGDSEHAEGVARALLSTLSRPYAVDHESARLSGSIGIALFPADADTVSELTSRADQAMYVAKAQGGNRCHFYSPADRAFMPEGVTRTRDVRTESRH